MMSPRSRVVLLATTTAIVVAFALVVLLDRPAGRSAAVQSSPSTGSASSDGPSASGFDGAALPAGVHAPGFTLTDQSGGAVSLGAYRGQVVLLAFLDSTCGSMCILIAQQIRGALDELPRPLAALLVSVDPRADTTTSIHRFLARTSLTGRVRYLTGPTSRLLGVWRAYGVAPAGPGHAVPAGAPAVLLIDPSGSERVLFPLEQLTPEALSHDIRRLQSAH
jgi:protein SCO1